MQKNYFIAIYMDTKIDKFTTMLMSITTVIYGSGGE